MKPGTLFKFIGFTFAFIIGASANARAVPMAPGDFVTLIPDESIGPVQFVISDELLPFQIFDDSGNLIIQGTLQDRVTRHSVTNTMSIRPRLRDLSTPSGNAWIVGLQIEGFGGYTTDVVTRHPNVSAGSITANDAMRSAGTGDALLFGYDPNLIIPPDEATFLGILTNALIFDQTGTITIFAQTNLGPDIYSATLDNTSAPAGVPVPEPSSLLLLGGGLAGLVAVGKKWNT